MCAPSFLVCARFMACVHAHVHSLEGTLVVASRKADRRGQSCSSQVELLRELELEHNCKFHQGNISLFGFNEGGNSICWQ